jgi:hypothetical protein
MFRTAIAVKVEVNSIRRVRQIETVTQNINENRSFLSATTPANIGLVWWTAIAIWIKADVCWPKTRLTS